MASELVEMEDTVFQHKSLPLSPEQDWRASAKKFRCRATWHPLIAGAAAMLYGWWSDVGEEGLPFAIVGAIVLGVWKEVLEARADHAQFAAIWMKDRGGNFTDDGSS